MLDPYLRVPFTHDGKGNYAAHFRLPDVHGMYTLHLQYSRKGYAHLETADIVRAPGPVHPVVFSAHSDTDALPGTRRLVPAADLGASVPPQRVRALHPGGVPVLRVVLLDDGGRDPLLVCVLVLPRARGTCDAQEDAVSCIPVRLPPPTWICPPTWISIKSLQAMHMPHATQKHYTT